VEDLLGMAVEEMEGLLGTAHELFPVLFEVPGCSLYGGITFCVMK
jgi:hypothetical protein